MELFIKCFVIGLSIALPVGPIGLLCIRNSLTYGMRMGLITGLGAAVADAIYGLVAGLGAYAIAHYVADYKLLFQIIGALFLCYLGVSLFLEKPKESESLSSQKGYLKTFIVTFFLTLLNPLTILSFLAIYMSMGESFASTSYLLMTLGVFLGSLSWWLCLSFGTSLFKNRIGPKTKIWLNRISGTTLLGYGVFSLFV